MKKKRTFKVVVTHPIQYHAVLWRSLSKLENFNFEVYFCSNHGQKVSLDVDFGVSFKWDVPLTDGYKNRTFRNYGFGKGYFKYLNPGLLIKLLFSSNDFVYFHGVNNFTAYAAFWLAKIKGSKTIIRNIAHLLDEEQRSPFKVKLRDIVYGSAYRHAAVCMYIGQHNKTFYKSFRVKERRLIHAPHIVDNSFFQKNRLAEQEIIDYKRSLGIKDNSIVLLFCGKLIPKKQPLLLLEALLNSNLSEHITLLFVGEGVLKKELQDQADSISNKNKNKEIKFLGFQNQTKLPQIYSITDILVLPSYHQETWGLVVNEALNFSSAIIVSDNVGCGPELVQDKTGLIFDRNSALELQNALEKMINNQELLNQYKLNCSDVIDNWSITEYTDSVKRIVNEEY